MVDKPRVSEETLYGIIALRPKNSEEVSLALDLLEAREELQALARMSIEHEYALYATPEEGQQRSWGPIPPSIELAYDIKMRYGWDATDK